MDREDGADAGGQGTKARFIISVSIFNEARAVDRRTSTTFNAVKAWGVSCS